jgi:hypothetical protein
MKRTTKNGQIIDDAISQEPEDLKIKRVYEIRAYTGDLSKDFYGSFDFKDKSEKKISIAPGTDIYLKGAVGQFFQTKN